MHLSKVLRHQLKIGKYCVVPHGRILENGRFAPAVVLVWNEGDQQRDRLLDLEGMFATELEASNRAREYVRAINLILEEVADFAAVEAQWFMDTELPEQRLKPDSSSG